MHGSCYLLPARGGLVAAQRRRQRRRLREQSMERRGRGDGKVDVFVVVECSSDATSLQLLRFSISVHFQSKREERRGSEKEPPHLAREDGRANGEGEKKQ